MNWLADHGKNLVLSGNEKRSKVSWQQCVARGSHRSERPREGDDDKNIASVSAICQECWHSSTCVNLKSSSGQDIYSYIRKITPILIISNVHRASCWRAIFTFSHFPGETKALRRTAGLIHLCLRDQHWRAGENYFAQAIRANIFEGKKKEKKSPMIGLEWWRLPMGHLAYGRCIHFSFRYVSFEQVQTSHISPAVWLFSIQDGSTGSSMTKMGTI